ncbi:MAG: hypothetical protein Q9200_003475 [Gallowayella weberi]
MATTVLPIGNPILLMYGEHGQSYPLLLNSYAQNIELKRPLALEQHPTGFRGLDPEQMSNCICGSFDPLMFALMGGQSIPCTALEVSNGWSWIDIDEILLERLRVVEKLRTLANFASYDTAFSHILETTDPDLRMLKPRELNFTHSLMRQNYGVAPVGRNVSGTAGIIVSGFLYGGLHMLAWGSTAFTSHLEDIAWKMSCFAVAGGGLFAFAGIFGLDVATKRQQAHRRLAQKCTRKEKRAVKALRYSMTCATIETVSMGYRNGFTVCEAMLHKLQTLSSVPYTSAPDPD